MCLSLLSGSLPQRVPDLALLEVCANMGWLDREFDDIADHPGFL